MSDQRIFELEQQIKHHNDLYWNKHKTEISDVEYDKLVEELRILDPLNELVQTFAQPNMDNISKDKLIKHSHKMLSLDKIYSEADLFKWIKKVSRTLDEKFIIQPKYDGMSGLLENGKLSSRGDGEYGQDYTDKLALIEFIGAPKNLNIKTDKLLGEILITNSAFKNIFNNVMSKAGVPFKNQRNGVAGILGTDDVDFYMMQGAKISFVVYGSFGFRVSAKDFETKWQTAVDRIRASDYPIDGIVIKLEDEEYGKSLGETAHHPKNAIAFKFTNQTAISKLIGVELSMGKAQISAVGIIEPIEISDTTIKRVKLQLTAPKNTSVQTCLIDETLQIGDTIVIEKAGDIIPHIVSSSPGTSRTPFKLDKCPFCGGKILIEETSISCLNPDCKEKLIQNLYCSCVTLGFKNIGEAYIRLIVNDESLKVKDLYDLLTLKKSDLKLQEYGSKMKDIFFGEIEKAKANCTKEQFLTALNIPNIGKNVSQILVENFTWDKILNNLDFNKLANINGIGEKTIISLKEAFIEKAGLIQRLNTLFNFNNQEQKGNNMENQRTICFTGAMSQPRKVLQELAVSRGLLPKDAVNKELNILVCADPNSGSTKLQKAQKYRIKIISEADFLNENY